MLRADNMAPATDVQSPPGDKKLTADSKKDKKDATRKEEDDLVSGLFLLVACCPALAALPLRNAPC